MLQLQKIYQLLSVSLFVAAIGAYIGQIYVLQIASMFWLFVIGEFAALIALIFLKEKEGLNLLLLFTFTFLSGLTLAPLLVSILHLKNGGNVLFNAIFLTATVFIAMSFFALKTKKDFTVYSGMMFSMLIILVVAGLLNLFFHSTVTTLVISSLSALLFSVYIIVDTQEIIKNPETNVILATVNLYLDILNIFVSLLQILGIINKDD